MTHDQLTLLRRHLLGAVAVITAAIEQRPDRELFERRLALLHMIADIECQIRDRRHIEPEPALVVQ